MRALVLHRQYPSERAEASAFMEVLTPCVGGLGVRILGQGLWVRVMMSPCFHASLPLCLSASLLRLPCQAPAPHATRAGREASIESIQGYSSCIGSALPDALMSPP